MFVCLPCSGGVCGHVSDVVVSVVSLSWHAAPIVM